MSVSDERETRWERRGKWTRWTVNPSPWSSVTRLFLTSRPLISLHVSHPSPHLTPRRGEPRDESEWREEAWEERVCPGPSLRYIPFLPRSFPHPPLVTPPSSLGFRSRGGCDRRELTTRGTGHDRGTRTVIHSASRDDERNGTRQRDEDGLIHSRSNPRILPPVPHVSISSHSHLLLFAPLRYATSLRTEDESVTRIRREDATWGV